MIKLLRENNADCDTISHDDATFLKEKYGMVKLANEIESRATKFHCNAPSGIRHLVSQEAHQYFEILFKPDTIGRVHGLFQTLSFLHLLYFSEKGIHRLVCQSIESCEGSIRKDLYSNIILAGGTLV